MSSFNLTTVDPILKQLYGPQKVEEVTYKNRPSFAMIRKYEGFGGRDLPVPLKFGNPQGRSSTFSNAQNNTTSSQYEDFRIKISKDYSIARITGDTISMTDSNSKAFLSQLTAAIDGAMASLSDAHETFIYRNGTGSLATVGPAPVLNQLVLSSPSAVTNFEVGMKLVYSAADGGVLGAGSATGETIAGVDRVSGTLTSTSATWATILTAIAPGNFLYIQGDAQDAGIAKKMFGYDSWVPPAAPLMGNPFNDVDRYKDSRLYGNRFDGTSYTVEEALIDGQSISARESGTPDRCFMHHVQMRRMKKEIGTRIQYTRGDSYSTSKSSKASISFEGVLVQGDAGLIACYAAAKCQPDIAWMLQSDTWRLDSAGSAVKMLQSDGQRLLRLHDEDGYEVRVGFYGNMECNAPGYNTRISLTVPVL